MIIVNNDEYKIFMLMKGYDNNSDSNSNNDDKWRFDDDSRERVDLNQMTLDFIKN